MEQALLQEGEKHETDYQTYEDDDDNNYYGRNDRRPNSGGKRICIYLCLIVFSPIVLVLSVLYIFIAIYFLATTEITEEQKKTGKIFGFEFWYRTPGKRLAVVSTPTTVPDLGDGTPANTASTDVLISEDFVRTAVDGVTKTNILDTCRHWSLRKSIEVTLRKDLERGPHGAAISADADRDKPRYLLHGWPDPIDLSKDDEVWFTHARTTTWASLYGWSKRLPIGRGMFDFNPSIDLDTAPDVFGYAYLVEVAKPGFYDGDEDRILKITNPFATNAPDHTSETERKVFARYNYNKVRNIGDFPKGDPDAYVFKGRTVIEEADLRVLHRYRILKPGVVAVPSS